MSHLVSQGCLKLNETSAGVYQAELSGCDGIVLPTASPDEDCVWNQYAVRCREPGPVRAALEANGIEWRHYYSEPAYRQPAMGAGRLPLGSCPEAERACAEVIALPVRPSCSAETIRGIAGVIRRALGSRA